MISNPATASTDCLALAVEFFDTPSRYPDLLHGGRPLPTDVTALLLAAAGNSSADDDKAAKAKPAEELQRAALFFIEQVLLARHASNYRILGLEPGASIDKIKEHHRLLMRIFHPDRQTTPDARSDAIATRINQAYNVLRSPDTRTAYDFSLTERQAKPRATSRPQYRQVTDIPDDPPMRMPTFVTRHLPQFALGGIALVAALGVTLIYVNRVPNVGAIGTSDSPVGHAMEYEPPQSPLPQPPPVIARALAETRRLESPPPPAAISVEITKSEEAPVPLARGVREREPIGAPAMMQTASVKPAIRPVAAQAIMPERLLPTPTPAAAEPAASNIPVAVNLPTALEIKPEPLRPDQLNSLVASLTEQYQRGDLDNLLELFDASAHIERGDKKQIRAEYGELFRNSENRVLHIWDMAWSGDSKRARGTGSFQARVIRKGDPDPRIYNGAVTIEVVQRNDRQFIIGLYHKAEN